MAENRFRVEVAGRVVARCPSKDSAIEQAEAMRLIFLRPSRVMYGKMLIHEVKALEITYADSVSSVVDGLLDAIQKSVESTKNTTKGVTDGE